MAVIQCKKTVPTDEGKQRQAALLAFCAFPELKHVILVDEDVDIFDTRDVLWAMNTRFQGDRDIITIPGVRCHPLDPSSDPDYSPSITDRGMSCKTIFDCTVPFHLKDRFVRAQFMETDPDKWLKPGGLNGRGVPVTNKTMELSDCKENWILNEKFNCWCLKDILYTDRAAAPEFQRLSIFVPGPYMKENGVIDPEGEMNGYRAENVPVIFENNSAGYMQMPHVRLEDPHCYARQYLERGFVYVTCGNRAVNRETAGESCAENLLQIWWI